MSAIPIRTLAEIIADAEAYQPPAVLPPGDAGTAAIYRLADTWALQLAQGQIDIDDAYVLAKIAAQTVEVHTQGRRRWKDTKPFLEWLIETQSSRFLAHLEIQYGLAERRLRTVAQSAVGRGLSERGVKAEIAAAAEEFDVILPIEILHEAYHAAVAQARSNARWMSTRGSPQG